MALQKLINVTLRKSQLEGEISDLIPQQSDLVVQAKDAVLELLDLPQLEANFRLLQTSLSESHEALTKLGSERLIKPVSDLAFESSALCDKSIVLLEKYSRATSDILETLQTTYQYLVDGLEDMALDCFSDIADGLVKELFDPTIRLQKQLEDARKSFEIKRKSFDSTTVTVEAEKMLKDLTDIATRQEKNIRELKSVRSRLRNRNNTHALSGIAEIRLSDLGPGSKPEHPLRVQVQLAPMQRHALESESPSAGLTSSKGGRGKPTFEFDSPPADLTSSKVGRAKPTFESDSPSADFTSSKVGRSKTKRVESNQPKTVDPRPAEEQMKHLSRALTDPLVVWTQPMLKQPRSLSADSRSDVPNNPWKNQVETLIGTRKSTVRKSREYADDLEILQGIALDSLESCQYGLQTSLEALDGILFTVRQALSFWTKLRDHCKQYGDESLQKDVEEALESMSSEERQRKWQGDNFKARAFKFYALWMALSSVCLESSQKMRTVNSALVAHLKKPSKTDYAYEHLKKTVSNFIQSAKREEQELYQKESSLKKSISSST